MGRAAGVTRRLAAGEKQVRRKARVWTRIRFRAGMGGGHGFVTACVRYRV
jgi:hypothetical protein